MKPLYTNFINECTRLESSVLPLLILNNYLPPDILDILSKVLPFCMFFFCCKAFFPLKRNGLHF